MWLWAIKREPVKNNDLINLVFIFVKHPLNSESTYQLVSRYFSLKVIYPIFLTTVLKDAGKASQTNI